MVHFVGAGCGAPDLITLRGDRLLREADVIIYAGSLVNPALLDVKKEHCQVYNSALMTLEEVLAVILEAEKDGRTTVRLHTGDPCLYGAIREQMDALALHRISYDYCPGVSSFCGAAASLGIEYTLPGISQTVIITRMAGKTPVPEQQSIRALAGHRATMVIFLSAGQIKELADELLSGGADQQTPAAIVYRATWPDEKLLRCTIGSLYETASQTNITKTALIIVGDILGTEYERSLLYHPAFETEFRKTKQDGKAW